MNDENICSGQDLLFMPFISVIDLNCSELNLIDIFCGTKQSNTNGIGALSWSLVSANSQVRSQYLCI